MSISTTFLLHHLAPFLYHLYLFSSFASSSFSSVFNLKQKQTNKNTVLPGHLLWHMVHIEGSGPFSSYWQHLCLPGQHWTLFKFLNLPLTGSRPDSLKLTAKATCLTQSQFKNKNYKVKDSDSEYLWGKKMGVWHQWQASSCMSMCSHQEI